MSKHHDPEMVLHMLRKLTTEDYLRLQMLADTLAFNHSHTSGGDLLHESIAATIEGNRKWPKDIATTTYLAMTMKSIRSNSNNVKQNHPHLSFDEDYMTNTNNAPNTPELILIQDENNQFWQMVFKQVELELAEDEIALLILHSKVDKHYSKSELINICKCTQTKYESALKKVNRTLIKVSNCIKEDASNERQFKIIS